MLSQESIGRITALIKHAITNNVIVHRRTQIVKNMSHDSQFPEEQKAMIKRIREKVIELLKGYRKEGLTMS